MEKKPFVLIDGSVLTNGMRVLVAGIDTAQFERNPVMFYLHDEKSLPIGRWTDIRKEDGKLLANADFDNEDDDKDVRRIIKKVQNDFIKMVSPGLVELKLSDDPKLKLPGQTGLTVAECRIREASIVPIGKNHNALRLYDNADNEILLGQKDTGLKLSDFIVKPNTQPKMSKKFLTILNLADEATDEMIEAAVLKLSDEKKAAESRAVNAEKELNDLKLADKAKTRQAFELELADAFRDGRLSEKPEGEKLTPVKDNMMLLFDANPEGTRAMLSAIPKPASLRSLELGGKDEKEYKELEAMDFGAMDKAGKTLLCRDKYPDLYKEKYKAKFGREPKV